MASVTGASQNTAAVNAALQKTAATTTTGTSQAAASKASLAGDMNTFMTMLTTQLKNQDPTSPMDSSKFTDQLVQFANVEQGINMNANLEKMLAVDTAGQLATGVGYIGTAIEAPSANVPLQAGQSTINYTLPSKAASVQVVISDQNNNVLRSVTGTTAMGKNTVNWDGTDAYGKAYPDGSYKFTVSATDGAKNPIDNVATVVGIVTSVTKDGTGAVNLDMSGVDVTLDKVTKVSMVSSTSSSSGTGTSTTGQ